MSQTFAELIEEVNSVAETSVIEIEACQSLDQVNEIRIQRLGKKGDITAFMKRMKEIPPEQKKEFGAAVNTAKSRVEEAIEARKESLESAAASGEGSFDFDITLPGIRPKSGHRHPVMAAMQEVKSILTGLGFRYDDYPEVETDFFNFDGLNTPSWHPARDMHDTFYTKDGNVMRTHTTAFQQHALKQFGPPPIKAMTSGRCYRCDEIDATHFPIFHQLDVIAIDRGITFADLKCTLYQLARGLFGDDVKLQFRPSFFPFTTPSAEVDVWFNGRWMEILGSGMMHPNVLKAAGLDPREWQGFAFGLGIDRIAMNRHGITDIRYMYDNEAAFLRQF